MANIFPGFIFLSHWSGNANVVNRLFPLLDQARAFLDVKSFEPGAKNIEEMKTAVASAAVFVFVISPEMPKECFAFYEAAQAEIEKARRDDLEILVWPINGASHLNCPEWMRGFFVIPELFSLSDVARQIRRSASISLTKSGQLVPPLYEGRENLERTIALDVNSKVLASGLPLNTLVLSGIPGMGRSTLARHLAPRLFPAKRDVIPEFDLQDAGEAIDLYIALIGDIEGRLSIDRASDLARAFPDDPLQQAKIITASLKHWAYTRHSVLIRARWSLRDQGRNLQPWFSALVDELAKLPEISVFFVSGRKLTPESIAHQKNLTQYEVPELDSSTSEYLLSKLIDNALYNPALMRRLAELSMGHPDTLLHVAYLINKGRSPETLLANQELVFSFQDGVLEDTFKAGILAQLDTELLTVLCWFPGISFSTLARIFPEESPQNICEALWELSDYCLIELSQTGTYRLPNIVRSTFVRRMPSLQPELEDRVVLVLRDLLDSDDLTLEQIEPIALAFSMKGEDFPERLKGAITPGNLSSIVERHYQRGLRTSDRDQMTRSLSTAARLAQMAISARASSDTLENILFQGADATTRLGQNPEFFVKALADRGFASAYYSRASFAYHVQRDTAVAIRELQAALAAGKFRKRSVRLLTRIYLREREARKALDTLDLLHPNEVKKDSGLLAMKIRSLRALRRFEEADELEADLRALPDEFGEIYIFEAVRALKKRNYNEARRFVDLAMSKPRANQATLTFLRCVIDLNNGDSDSLPNACAIADRMGRADDARQLRARAALQVEKNWRRAEAELRSVVHRTWFDWQLELEIIDEKLKDAEIQRDAAALRETNLRKEEVVRQIVSSLDVID